MSKAIDGLREADFFIEEARKERQQAKHYELEAGRAYLKGFAQAMEMYHLKRAEQLIDRADRELEDDRTPLSNR